nr:hypothetical protein [Candidatus Sigynarchaeota archaeon]
MAPIPHPRFRSWMHERCELPSVSLKQKLEWWKQQPDFVQAIEAVVSRAMYRVGCFRGIRPWVTYKFIMKVFWHYFRIFNQLRVFGVDNIPKSGCIFYINHPGSYDPIIMFSTIPHIQPGGFVSWGNSWFADMIDRLFNLSAFRYNNVHYVVEDMVRKIFKNPYFAIWPEGHPHMGPIEQGFSSIVRVYATINHDKDRIPFLPVLVRGEGTLRYGVSHKMGPMEVHFFKPFFIDRAWLRRPDEGGKTPREIIDYMMFFLAKKNGQKELAKNFRLEGRKSYFDIQGVVEKQLASIKFTCDARAVDKCEICKSIPWKPGFIEKNAKDVPEAFAKMEDYIEDPTNIHRLVHCPSCDAWYSIAHRDGAYKITALKSIEWLRRIAAHVIIEHQAKIKAS